MRTLHGVVGCFFDALGGVGFLGWVNERFLDGRGALFDGVGGTTQFQDLFLVDGIHGIDLQVIQNHVLRHANLGKVTKHLLACCLDIDGLAQCDGTDAFNHCVGYCLGDNGQDGVTACDGGRCVAGHDLHIFRKGVTVLCRYTAFHFHGNGKVRFKVVTYGLRRDGLAIVADDA